MGWLVHGCPAARMAAAKPPGMGLWRPVKKPPHTLFPVCRDRGVIRTINEMSCCRLNARGAGNQCNVQAALRCWLRNSPVMTRVAAAICGFDSVSPSTSQPSSRENMGIRFT
jgi:hypothetical protein